MVGYLFLVAWFVAISIPFIYASIWARHGGPPIKTLSREEELVQENKALSQEVARLNKENERLAIQASKTEYR